MVKFNDVTERHIFYLFIICVISIWGCDNNNNRSKENNEQKNEQKALANEESIVVSNKELKKYAHCFIEVREIDNEQQRMVYNMIKKAGLDMVTFRRMQGFKKEDSLRENFTEKEIYIYKKLLPEIEKINKEINNLLTAELEKNGLTLNRFEEITDIIEQNPKLLRKFQDEMKKYYTRSK